MISPDSVFGNFVVCVAFMRQLQTTPLKQWSAAKSAELDRITADVDEQLRMMLTRSVMADQFAAIIDQVHGEHS